MRPRSDEREQRRPRPHVTSLPIVEDVVFTLLSVFVLFAMATTLLSQPNASIAFAAKPDGPGPNPNFMVLYGVLGDSQGVPIPGATIQVIAPNGRVVGEDVTAADGTYRIRFKEVSAPYEVVFTAVYAGQTVTGTTTLDMVAGYSYGLNATLEQPNSYIWVAIPAY